MKHANDRLIVALDFTTLPPALAMVRRLRGVVGTVKVGSALFTACGPAVIQRLRRLGFDVMLDLKFHDIPSTVERSCRAAVHHHIRLLTVHTAGGREMLAAAVRGVALEAKRLRVPRPLVLGVTVLTSAPGAGSAVTTRVVALARVAREGGCDGVVASAQDALALRARFGRRLRVVCPGIRLPDGARGDQRRVATPREALARGADWLVVGRPITAARDPRAAAHTIVRDMEDVHG